MSKLAAIKVDLDALDAASQLPARLRGLLLARGGMVDALEAADQKLIELIDALQDQIKATQGHHKIARDQLSAEIFRYDNAIAAEKRAHEPAEAENTLRAQSVAAKYGKTIGELRQIVADLTE